MNKEDKTKTKNNGFMKLIETYSNKNPPIKLPNRIPKPISKAEYAKQSPLFSEPVES